MPQFAVTADWPLFGIRQGRLIQPIGWAVLNIHGWGEALSAIFITEDGTVASVPAAILRAVANIPDLGPRQR